MKMMKGFSLIEVLVSLVLVMSAATALLKQNDHLNLQFFHQQTDALQRFAIINRLELRIR